MITKNDIYTEAFTILFGGSSSGSCSAGGGSGGGSCSTASGLGGVQGAVAGGMCAIYPQGCTCTSLISGWSSNAANAAGAGGANSGRGSSA